ncbi:response regulator [Candidatus Nitrosotenuis chungbukensis]|uniref:response regulator n=1 Tax=Candidatus Nitrosotenuis chungbukensis TaxID=1353246 RepID=UPI0005B2A496|nr:response regulator [Candidatus Nitrosotenuis chungbukensis]WKT57868.1 response regulator [Candidatus Nitrosotenuis chungbukensis]
MITVAIIDNDDDTIQVFAEYLELLGVKVVLIGHSAEQAVGIYKKHRPDVLFLDLMAPDCDGISCLNEIRAIDPQANVIITATHLTAEDEENLDKLKPNEIILKPFDMKKLKAIFDKMIKTDHPAITHVDDAKKALVSFTITQALLQMSQSAASEVGSRLYAKYHCYFSDCLGHPEYLKDILQEIFGNGSDAIIKTIKEKLAAYGDQQPISDFLVVLER